MKVKTNRWAAILATLALGAAVLPAGGTFAQGDSRTFPETGQAVSGRFLEYWDQNGGLAQQGFPISGELQEVSDTNGQTYTVQYFERAVFELHPENTSPYDVLLSLLGVAYYEAKYPQGAPGQTVNSNNALTFPETGHSVGGRFREYWEANGGLAQQGYPISDEFQEVSDLNGQTYTVQYFERAVFELHPENQAPNDVLLSQLGTFQQRFKQAAADGPVTVGLLSDQSGALAIYGPMLERGFELGLDYWTGGTGEVFGREINVVVKDTASDVNTGTNLAREAIESDGADILVGVPSSSVALAVSGVAAENEVVYISGPAASPDLTGAQWNPYTFRASRTSVQDALTMASALVDLGDTFVQIAPDNAFGRGSAGAFYNVIKAAGGNFPVGDTAEEVGSIFPPLDTTNFTPYLNQILDSQADVLVVTWAGTGFVPLFQQMQQLGILDNMVVATGMGDNQTLAAGYADAVGSVGVSVYHYSTYDNNINNWLVEQHRERFGSPPDLFTEGGFVAAEMVVKSLLKSFGSTESADLIKALEGMKFDGPKGAYEIRAEDHVLLQPMALVELTNTTDADFRFFDVVKVFTGEETAPPCAVPADKGRCP